MGKFSLVPDRYTMKKYDLRWGSTLFNSTHRRSIFLFVSGFVSLFTLEDMSDLFDGVYSVTREVIGETCTSYFSN